MKLAFFDDYPLERGHHPDYLLGMAAAARGPLFCPDSFLDNRPKASGFGHYPVVGAPDGAPSVTRANLEFSCERAAGDGCDVVVNAFIDENWDAFPVDRRGLRFLQCLHRPGELPGTLGGVNETKPGDAVATIRMLGETDLVVVHTATGEQQARQWLPPERVVRLGWPAATVDAVRERFARPISAAAGEPYVLLVGEALEYKGIHVLLRALADGPLLRIAGNLAIGDCCWLSAVHPGVRASWEPGWTSRARMEELLVGASVVVFPYVAGFAAHGGVSAALVHALTFASRIVVSAELAPQLPLCATCTVVPTGDAEALRAAIDVALAKPPTHPAGSAALLAELEREHTYEGHVTGLIERLAW